MGLNTSHGCWHGAYSAFMRWRMKIAEVSGLPPLQLMEGFFGETLQRMMFGKDEITKQYLESSLQGLPIKWECLKPSPLHELLHHSDCDGEIPAASCGPIADELSKLIPLLPDEDAGGHIGNWREKTQQFIDGLRAASSANEPVEFG